MKAQLLAAVAALTLAGCASTAMDQSPSQTYRPAGTDKQITITGNMETQWKHNLIGSYVGRKVSVLFDGAPVVSGWLTDPDNGAGILTGEYHGLPVEADCSGQKSPPNTIYIRCRVLVDNERAATLTF